MNNTITKAQVHDFLIRVNAIEFDFGGYAWEEEYETEQEWLDYKQELTNKYQTFSVLFQEFPLPENDDEDETIAGNEDLKGCEEGYYYRKLERWIDENICWLILDIDYEVEKI
jgi:hypothetical protein